MHARPVPSVLAQPPSAQRLWVPEQPSWQMVRCSRRLLQRSQQALVCIASATYVRKPYGAERVIRISAAG